MFGLTGRPLGRTRGSHKSLNEFHPVQVTPLPERIASLPKAELHLHLEGSIRPAIASALAARHGVGLEEEEVRRRCEYTNFAGFLDAVKWVTSFVREPKDFVLIAADLAGQ